MTRKRPPTIRDQTLSVLREGLRSRRWAGVLPGVRPLAKELGVSVGTLQAALRQLESEGLLAGKGWGIAREVVASAVDPVPSLSMRVGILLPEPMLAESTLNQALMNGIAHELELGGHRPFFAPKAMLALRHDPESIRTMMTEAAADAWVVFNSKRPLLEVLATGFSRPVIAVGGLARGLDLALVAVSIKQAIREGVRRLAALGHSRIVFALSRQDERFQASNDPNVVAFNEELAAAGIKPGRYNVPYWEPTGEGFDRLLHSLFALTPPTALFLDDVRQLCAVHMFLAMRRISPRDLTIVLLGADPTLDWVTPAPIHVRYDNGAMIRRVAAWADTLAAGGRDTSMVLCEAELVGDRFLPPPRG